MPMAAPMTAPAGAEQHAPLCGFRSDPAPLRRSRQTVVGQVLVQNRPAVAFRVDEKRLLRDDHQRMGALVVENHLYGQDARRPDIKTEGRPGLRRVDKASGGNDRAVHVNRVGAGLRRLERHNLSFIPQAAGDENRQAHRRCKQRFCSSGQGLLLLEIFFHALPVPF
jgi:hypothetical protein